MDIFSKMANGWEISKSSLKVLRANKSLILFPILSGISMVLIIATFITFLFTYVGWNFDNEEHLNYLSNINRNIAYFILFLYYIINYFIAVFFNIALTYCAKLYFEGEEVTLAKGIKFSLSRAGVIFAWSIFAATAGIILKIAQDNLGWVGKIIIGLTGIVWSLATFFVVPILAFENVGPAEALSRSTKLMKEKWGESTGASFSFASIAIIGFLAVLFITFIVAKINIFVGVAVGYLGMLLLVSVIQAVKSIFISAVYCNKTNEFGDNLNQQIVDNLFVEKKK